MNVSVSGSALTRVAAILQREHQARALRISVEGGGCSGFSYKYELVEETLPDDLVIDRDGARIVIDSVSLPFLDGAEIDFIDDLMGQAFQINNPNVTSSCGCGTSFAI